MQMNEDNNIVPIDIPYSSKILYDNIEKLNIVATYNLIYNSAFFVEEGFGSALTLDKLVHMSEENNLCFKPLTPTLKTNLVMVWKKYQVFSKASQTFLNELQKELQDK